MKEIWQVQLKTLDNDNGKQFGESIEIYYSSLRKAKLQFEKDIEDWKAIGYEVEDTGNFPNPYAIIRGEVLTRMLTIRCIEVY